MLGKWLSNIFDPYRQNSVRNMAHGPHETPQEAYEHQEKWLADKVIGPPQATEAYTSEELRAEGIIGVYDGPACDVFADEPEILDLNLPVPNTP